MALHSSLQITRTILFAVAFYAFSSFCIGDLYAIVAVLSLFQFIFYAWFVLLTANLHGQKNETCIYQ